jgi:hypothetical protein
MVERRMKRTAQALYAVLIPITFSTIGKEAARITLASIKAILTQGGRRGASSRRTTPRRPPRRMVVDPPPASAVASPVELVSKRDRPASGVLAD